MTNKYYKEIDGEQVFFKGCVLYLDGATIINPTEEQMLEAGWQVYVEPEPTAAEKLAAAKSEKLTQIDMYDSSENVNSFTINDTPMWLDHELRQQIKTSVEAYIAVNNNDATVNVTKWFNGTEFTFPAASWLQMLAALEVYAAEALNVTESHRAAVMAMTRRKDVEDYDYTAGYPEKLVF